MTTSGPALPVVVVAGLGPAGPDLVPPATLAAVAQIPHRYLRTARHPAAIVAGDCASFDDRYDAAATFDEVYDGIVSDLVTAARLHGRVCYLVPGSPWVLESTVGSLVDSGSVRVDVIPGTSFVELAWDRLGVDPFEKGVRLVDGHRFVTHAAAERGPLLVADCHNRRVLSDVKLAYAVHEPDRAVILHHLGLPDEVVAEVAWADLDRSVEADHLTSVWIPATGSELGRRAVELVELVKVLRERCPWDRAQTHRSLTRHLIEETYEVLEAIDALDAAPLDPVSAGSSAGEAELCEELGDLAFQVAIHSVIAAERGAFDLDDVLAGIHDKLVSRHPHVFAPTVDSAPAQDLAARWEAGKVAEKGRTSVMEGIPASLPALLFADKVRRKAASQGVAWGDLLDRAGIAAGSLERRLLDAVEAAAAGGADAEDLVRRAAHQAREAFDSTPGP